MERTGGDAIDLDIIGTEFDGQIADEGFERGFDRPHATEVGDGAPGARRGDADDLAASARSHERAIQKRAFVQRYHIITCGLPILFEVRKIDPINGLKTAQV